MLYNIHDVFFNCTLFREDDSSFYLKIASVVFYVTVLLPSQAFQRTECVTKLERPLQKTQSIQNEVYNIFLFSFNVKSLRRENAHIMCLFQFICGYGQSRIS